jgi:AcrR family transcriptional regulator
VATDSGIGKRRALARKEGNPAYVEKRNQMIKAAASLFKEKGYEATTLNDIAEAIGADRATVYYYVASKEELLHEAVGDTSSANLDMMRALQDSDLSALDRVRSFIENTLTLYEQNYPQVFVYIQEDMTKVARKKGAWAKRMASQIRDFESGLVQLLQAGVDDGSFRDDLDIEIVAKALWGMLNWTHRWHKPGGGTSAQQIADTFAAVFLGGLAKRPRSDGLST